MHWLVIVEMLLIWSSGIGLCLAWYAWRQRSTPGHNYFSLVMVAVAFYAVAVACELASSGIPAKVLWSKIQYLATSNLAALWMLFALSYGQYGGYIGRRLIVALWLIPAVALCLVWTNEWHGLAWPAIYPLNAQGNGLVVYQHGPAVWCLVIYSYVLMVAAAALLLFRAYASARLFRGQMTVLLVALAAPLGGNVLYFSGVYRGFDLAPLLFTVSGALILWAIFRWRLLKAMPIAYDAILTAMQEGVVFIDAENRVVDVNPAASTLLRLPAGAIAMTAEQALGAWPQATVLSEGLREMELAAPDLSRGSTWLETRVTPVYSGQNHFAGKLLLVRDISERKNAEEARRRLDAQAMQAQKIESLGVLAGGIAHEFNNLLMVIQGNAELAIARLGPEAQVRTYLDAVNEAVERAAELAKHMLAYAGRVQLQPALVDVSDVVRHTAPMIRVIVPGHVALSYELSERIPPARIDVVQMRQAVMNLARNAVEAIGETPGAITIKTGVITCGRDYFLDPGTQDLLAEGDYLFIDVVDTGPGLDASALRKVFDPFFSTKFLGRGLGLPATLGVVHGHKGTIRVDSAPGKGATFRLLLPAETPL